MEELASLGLEAKLYLILGRHKRIKWGVGKAKLSEPSMGVCVGGGGGGGGLDSIYLYGLKVKGKHERSMLKVPPNLD